MYPALLGERLTRLRAIMVTEGLVLNTWSRASLARTVALTPAVVARFEKSGTGTAANLLVLLRFYEIYGFNLAWILTPENERIPLFAFQNAFQSGDISEAYEQLDKLRQLVQSASTEGHAVKSALGHGATNTLLSDVQALVHQAIVNILPPIRAITSEADLRLYQRRLPPVAAASAGWRSRAINQLPLHYYEAGESVPRCGTPTYYLAFQTTPAQFSNSICCPFCIQQTRK